MQQGAPSRMAASDGEVRDADRANDNASGEARAHSVLNSAARTSADDGSYFGEPTSPSPHLGALAWQSATTPWTPSIAGRGLVAPGTVVVPCIIGSIQSAHKPSPFFTAPYMKPALRQACSICLQESGILAVSAAKAMDAKVNAARLVRAFIIMCFSFVEMSVNLSGRHPPTLPRRASTRIGEACLKAKPPAARCKTTRRTELRRASAQAARRLAQEGAEREGECSSPRSSIAPGRR